MGQWTPYHWHKSLKRFHPDSLVRICDPDKPNDLGVGFCKVRDLVGEKSGRAARAFDPEKGYFVPTDTSK
jgi:hypothetical protein